MPRKEQYVVAMPFKRRHLRYRKDRIDGKHVETAESFSKWVKKCGGSFFHDQPPKRLRYSATRILYAWADGTNPWLACGEAEIALRAPKRGPPEPRLGWRIRARNPVAWKPVSLPRRTKQGQRQVPLTSDEYDSLRRSGLN